MTEEVKFAGGTLRLMKVDITDVEVDAFVYYAREDLQLGSGFGTAIMMRGGPSVQEELDGIGKLELTKAVVTKAGEMKANHIVHAVGPKFQEEGAVDKLRQTIRNAFAAAEEAGVKNLALPPMGAGFYGVPLPESAEITTSEVSQYLSNKPKINEIIICCLDKREFKAFQPVVASAANS